MITHINAGDMNKKGKKKEIRKLDTRIISL